MKKKQLVDKGHIASLHPELSIMQDCEGRFKMTNRSGCAKWPTESLSFLLPQEWSLDKNGGLIDPLKPFGRIDQLIANVLPDRFSSNKISILFGKYVRFRNESEFVVTEPKMATHLFIRVAFEDSLDISFADPEYYDYLEKGPLIGTVRYLFLVSALNNRNHATEILIKTCRQRLSRQLL